MFKNYRALTNALADCIITAQDNGATPRDVLTALCATMSFAVAILEPEHDATTADFLEEAVPKIMEQAVAARRAGEMIQ
jgi:hypothetical protein